MKIKTEITKHVINIRSNQHFPRSRTLNPFAESSAAVTVGAPLARPYPACAVDGFG
jgi:hypothetical protein